MKHDASLSPVRSLLVGLLSILFTTLLAAAEPASLRITQVLTHGTDITAYVAVRDESGGAVSGDSLKQAKATLGTHIAEIMSAQPFAATGEGVLYLFLVDISRSLDNAQFDRLRQALTDWVAAMGEKDRAALLAFGEQVNTLVAPTADQAALNTAIAGLGPKDNRTALHQALAQGLTLGQQTGGELPSRRAIVILSDGQDDAPGGMTAEEVEQRFGEAAVPIYAIGFSKGRDRTAREAGLAALGRFARRSGGLFVDASAGDPGAAYAEMRERIRAVDRLQLNCADCIADGNRYRLQIALPHAGRTLTDGVDLRLYPALLATAGPATPATTPAAEATPVQQPSVEASPPPSADATPHPSAEASSPPAAEAAPSPTADATPAPSADSTPPSSADANQTPPVEASPSSSGDASRPPSVGATPSYPVEVSQPPAAEASQVPSADATSAPSAEATPPAAAAAMVPASTAPPSSGLNTFFNAWWPWLVGGGAILVIAIITLAARRKPQPTPDAVPAQPVVPAAAVAPLPQVQPAAPLPEATRRSPPAPSGPTLTLAFMNGPRRGETVPLVMAPDVVVGRAAACTLTLAGDDEVSGRHARFFIQSRRLLLEDLGSTNGTWLNGVRLVAPSPLSPGDVMQCGQTELRFIGIGHQSASAGYAA